MEKRNFNILIASICIIIVIVALSIYNFQVMGIDPFKYAQDNILGVDEDETVVTIKGDGVKENLELSLSDLKSDKYLQVKDREFHFINSIGREYDDVFSGVSLWSILEEEGLLEGDGSTFQFEGADGFKSEKPLSLELAENFTKDVILAYEQDGEPIFNDGPVRSIVDYDVIPDETTSLYAVKSLKYVLIE